jgi:hypothetical protein
MWPQIVYIWVTEDAIWGMRPLKILGADEANGYEIIIRAYVNCKTFSAVHNRGERSQHT